MNEKSAIERLEKYKKYAENSGTVYDMDLHNACIDAPKRSAEIEKNKAGNYSAYEGV